MTDSNRFFEKFYTSDAYKCLIDTYRPSIAASTGSEHRKALRADDLLDHVVSSLKDYPFNRGAEIAGLLQVKHFLDIKSGAPAAPVTLFDVLSKAEDIADVKENSGSNRKVQTEHLLLALWECRKPGTALALALEHLTTQKNIESLYRELAAVEALNIRLMKIYYIEPPRPKGPDAPLPRAARLVQEFQERATFAGRVKQGVRKTVIRGLRTLGF